MIDIHVEPDIWNMLAQWAATLILFLVVRHFVYKPMNEFLTKRQNQVMTDLNEADTKKKEALALKAQYENELSTAQQQGQEIVEESRKRANLLEQEKIQEAKDKADALIQKARIQIENERKVASEEVRAETADLAVLIAEKLLIESMDESRQEELVNGFIKELEQNHVH